MHRFQHSLGNTAQYHLHCLPVQEQGSVCVSLFNIYIWTRTVRLILRLTSSQLRTNEIKETLDQHSKTLQGSLHRDRSGYLLAVAITIITLKLIYIWRVSSSTSFIQLYEFQKTLGSKLPYSHPDSTTSPSSGSSSLGCEGKGHRATCRRGVLPDCN